MIWKILNQKNVGQPQEITVILILKVFLIQQKVIENMFQGR